MSIQPPSTFQVLDLAPSPTSSPITQPNGFTFSNILSHHSFFDAYASSQRKPSRCADVSSRRCRWSHPPPASPEIRGSDTSLHDFSVVIDDQYFTQDIVRKLPLWHFWNERSRLIVDCAVGELVASEERWRDKNRRNENAPASV